MAPERDRTVSHNREHSDLALVDAARNDRDAFGILYERHVDRIYSYALRRLRDPELAADVTAVAFSRALANLGRFQEHADHAGPGSSFARWLMTIAGNAVIDTVRERRNIVALDADTLAQMRSVAGNDPAQSLPPDDRIRIEAAIRALGSPQQEIVVLRLQGWKGEEIADLLGMTHGAVRTAQHRAYATLREALADLRPSTSSQQGASS